MNVSEHRKKWRAEWRDAAKKKARKSFDSQADAELFKAVADANTPVIALAYFAGELDDDAIRVPVLPALPPAPAPAPGGVSTDLPGEGYLFVPYALAYLDQRTGITERGAADDLRMFESYIRPYWGSRAWP